MILFVIFQKKKIYKFLNIWLYLQMYLILITSVPMICVMISISKNVWQFFKKDWIMKEIVDCCCSGKMVSKCSFLFSDRKWYTNTIKTLPLHNSEIKFHFKIKFCAVAYFYFLIFLNCLLFLWNTYILSKVVALSESMLKVKICCSRYFSWFWWRRSYLKNLNIQHGIHVATNLLN